MYEAIAADGKERNLPWRLIKRQGPKWNVIWPVQGLRAGSSPMAVRGESAAEARALARGKWKPDPATIPDSEIEDLPPLPDPVEGEPVNWEAIKERERRKLERAKQIAKEKAEWWRQERAQRTAFSKFVLSFEDGAEARRFARCWNGRELWDERTERVVRVEAVALW